MPISPLEGEMSCRTEGGIKATIGRSLRRHQLFFQRDENLLAANFELLVHGSSGARSPEVLERIRAELKRYVTR